jgi:Smg protein
MIDILVYLFETYGYADACPNEPEQLARKLSAAGFEDADISNAIEWLADLRAISSQDTLLLEADSRSMRIFGEGEEARLDATCRGFLMFLAASGVLDARQRELIIERAMALPDDEISLSKFKVIVLMVLWQDKANVDSLILDELLTEEVDEPDDWSDAVTVH